MHNLRPTSCLFLETIAGLDGLRAGPMHHLDSFGTISHGDKNLHERLTNLFLSACVVSGSQVVIFFVGAKNKLGLGCNQTISFSTQACIS